jgi:CHAT domain-containing protein
MMNSQRLPSLRRLHGLALLLVAVLAARPLAVTAAEPPAPAEPPARAAASQTREYLHHQPPDTTLVFRFEPFESEFESRLFDADAAPFKVSGIPGLRIGPLFQFVEAVDSERQLRIEVTLGWRSSRARIEMQLVRFDRSGPNQELQQKAYRLMSHGLELAPSNRVDLWQLKVMSLKQAAVLFDTLGMQEPMLWAEFYASHFQLERLGDALSAAEGARLLQPAALRARHNRILLAALQLEGRALLALATAGGGSATYDRARELLEQAAARAAEMDYQHERALALFYSGLAFEREGRHADAFARYDQALDATSLIGDVDFANALRRHAAGLHERLGDTDAAIAMMQQIDSEQVAPAQTPADAAAAAGDGRSQRDMARYLYDQGRLLEKAYRHDEAIGALRQALALERDTPKSGIPGPAGLLLGKALFQAGRIDEAAQQLTEAIPQTAASAHASALLEAWGILATIHRSRGEYDAMTAAREQQSKFAATPQDAAQLAYQHGLDALASAGRGAPAARQRFREALRGADTAGLANLTRLGRLQLCALAGSAGPADGDCSAAAAQRELESLRASAPPADAFEARWLWVRIQQQQDRHAQAAAAIENLLEDMLFYQDQLPGVLGAWYWLQRDAVFDTFLQLQLQTGAAGGPGVSPALLTLAALDALRTPAPAGGAGTELPADAERLRSLFAAREEAAAAHAPAAQNAEIAALLERLPKPVGRADLAARARQLAEQLNRLSAAESLLAYYVATGRAHAWVGDRRGIRLIPLRWDAGRMNALAGEIEALRSAAAAGAAARANETLDRLGEWLLEPVAAGLNEVIHFLPAGRLEGLPLDGLRWNGRYLAASHRVINRLTLAALAKRVPAAAMDSGSRVFIAGNWQERAGDFALSTPPSAEIGAVAARFVGPGLTLMQGAALQWDEFQDARFAEANLLHLAMPCAEDLRDSAHAHLLMSDNADDPERQFLRAGEIPAPLKARLAVLSNCEFVGASGSPLGRGSSLVGAMLAAGADAVIASLWRVGDEPAAEFMRRFYARLAAEPDSGRALADAKREFLTAAATDATLAWAAFQLFIE